MTARFPMSPYPTGWYVVAYSDELPAKQVLPLRYFGTELVLFRAVDGVPALLDAYCPHLGTHLGHGGTVDAGGLRCPMHGWRFDTAGACTAVPYATGLPRDAGATAWPLVERSGLLWTHYPATATPGWEPPEIAEHGAADWTPFSDDGNRWRVRTHAQLIQENACDIQHLRELHEFPEPKVGDVGADGPVFHSAFTHQRVYAEAGVADPIEVATRIAIHGLGLSKQNSVAMGVIESTSLCTTTPIDEDLVDLRMASAVKHVGDDDTTTLVHDQVLATTRTTIEEDIPIWETRTYANARYFAGDAPITAFRRWAEQFYGENTT